MDSSLRDLRGVEKALRERYPRLVTLEKARRSSPGFGSSSRAVLTEFDFEWLSVLRKYPDTERGYFLRSSDVERLKHAICLDARGTPAQIFDCVEDFSMMIKRESLGLSCS